VITTHLLFAAASKVPAKAGVPQKAIALTIFVLVLLVWLLYVITENRRTTKTNVESFLNAPNRKAAPDDDVFEGPRLDRFLGWALIGITLTALSLPLYWLGERGRQEGSIRGFDRRSVHRGETNYNEVFLCLNCHGAGGGGGPAPWTVAQYNADGTPKIDPVTKKQVLKSVSWMAPRINNVGLRYKEDQIRNVLIYGRGSNKPMPAWGLKGGGPGNEQQIDDLVNFLKHWAVEENETAMAAYNKEWKLSRNSDKAFEAAFVAAKVEQQSESTKALAEEKETAKKNIARLDGKDPKTIDTSIAALEKKVADAGTDEGLLQAANRKLDEAKKLYEESKAILAKTDGQLLFESNCARCHTNGWSYGEPKEIGGGFYGPKLNSKSLKTQFPEAKAQVEFVKNGVDEGKAYGTGGVNHYAGGGMPYFGNLLTDEQITAIVEYERSLG
jgi:mono/diheme cytochrome c family protein